VEGVIHDSDIRKLVRAAKQRFESSEILFRNEAFHDSMYLAGYVVEIALKALVLTRIPISKRQLFERNALRGSRTHDFDYLWDLIKQRGMTLPIAVAEALQRIRSWRIDLRYDVGRGEPDEAEEYLNSALEILRWVERSV
jgi:HEPN domain-containing protein